MNDYEGLARAVLGLPEDAYVEQDLMEKFDLDIYQFRDIVDALIPFTVPADVGGCRGEPMVQGFVRDGAFIVRRELDKKTRTTNSANR